MLVVELQDQDMDFKRRIFSTEGIVRSKRKWVQGSEYLFIKLICKYFVRTYHVLGSDLDSDSSTVSRNRRGKRSQWSMDFKHINIYQVIIVIYAMKGVWEQWQPLIEFEPSKQIRNDFVAELTLQFLTEEWVGVV